MKKFTLFLMTMVLSMVGALSSFAQEPAAPKFSPVATDGETIQYLYNVETHAFVLGANDWGTRASVSVEKGNQFKVTESNGKYKLSDLVGSNWNAIDCDGNADSWVDGQGRAGDGTWVLTDLGNNTYEITNTVGSASGKTWGVVRDLSNTRVVFKAPGAAYGATWAFVNAEDYEEYIANLDKAAVDAYIATQADVVNEALKDEIKAAQKVALDAMKSLIDGTNIYGEGFEAYAEKYNSYMEQFEAGTLTETVVNPSAVTGWHASTAYNFLLTPWISADKACNNFDNNLYINTWSTEGIGDGSNFLVPFFEYWTGDDASLGANTIKTTVTGLVPGKTYTASVWARVRIKNNGGADANGITFQVGEGEAVNICDGDAFGVMRVKQVTATGVADENGELVIAFNVAADNNVSWLSFKNVKCEEVVDLDLTITPAFVVEGEEEVVTLNDHSSVSVPSATALKVNFGDLAGVRTATYVINELVEDEFMGVVDVIEEEVASGLLSINTIGYVAFDQPLTFYYGHKYNIKVKAFAGDEESYWMEPAMATFECEFNGATDAQPAVAMGQPNFGDRVVSGMEVDPAEWEGLTVSFPENNVANALAGTDALTYGAVMLVGTDATLYEDGEAIATENNAMSSEFSEVELFSSVDLKAGKTYSVKIPAGGLKLVNMMEFMGDYEGSCVLWSSDEDIEFNFTTPEEEIEIAVVNGDFKDGFNGWTTEVAGGNFAINTEREPNTIEVYAGWGSLEATDFSISQKIFLPAGTYKLSANAFYRYGLTYDVDPSKSCAKLYAGNDSIAIATLGGIALDSYANSMVEASAAFANGLYNNELLFTVEEDGEVEIGIAGAHELKQSWFLASNFAIEAVSQDELAIYPSLVLGDDEVAINDHSEVSVDMADGIKVAFENGAAVRGVSYAINVMKQVSDEEGTTWVADESFDLAVGELSLNNVAYGQFEEPIIFEQGNKYQVKVTAYVANGTEEYDEVVKYYIINGAHALEIVVTPALIDGENEVTLNDHSAVSVEAANAIKVNIENAPEAIGVTYAINAMKQVTTEEGTTWVADESYDLAVGEANMNSIAYAEFENPVVFAYGKKYMLKVSVFGQPASDPQEIGTYYYEFNGATEVELAAGDYVIKNVESGLFLNGANSWGTKASAVKHGQFMTVAKLEDGTYTIDSHISNGGDKHYLAAGDNTFLDALPAYHTIEMVAPGIFAVKDSNDKYLAAGEDGLINFNADEVTEAAKWQFISKEQLIVSLEDATAAEPADATALIGDANFSRNNQWISKWDIQPGKGGPNENMNAEKWGGNSQTFVSAQTLTDLPNGFYTLKAQGFYRYNDTTDNTNDVAIAAHADGTEVIYSYLFANNDSVALTSIADEATIEANNGVVPFSQSEAAAAFNLGLYQNEINFEVTDGTIKLGIAKVEHLGCDWTVWDNFELYYLGTGAVDPIEIETAFVGGEEEVTLNTHSNVSVEAATGIKVNVMNCPQAVGVTYVINEMIQREDEEGTFWIDGQELAVGEASMNTIAFAEFENELVFEQGKKYKVTVTVFGKTEADPEEVASIVYEFNGAYAPEIAEDCPLTTDMFHEWTSYEAGADIVGNGYSEGSWGVSAGTVFGNPSVLGNNYADLSAWGTLALTVTEGTPRLLLNRQSNDGSSADFIEIKDAENPYVTVEGNVWFIDLAKIVEDKGYAHLNVIKGANWANVNITDAQLYGASVEEVIATSINGIATSTKANGKYFVNGKVVIVNNGVKYNAAGAVIR